MFLPHDTIRAVAKAPADGWINFSVTAEISFPEPISPYFLQTRAIIHILLSLFAELPAWF